MCNGSNEANTVVVKKKLWPTSGENGGGNSYGAIIYNKLWPISGGN